MLLNYVVWDVNPEIFSIGPLTIRYYGVMWALTFYLGYLIFERIVKREGLPEGFLDKLIIYMAIATILGARLGHCLFYEPEYYLSRPLEILMIWRGGLSSHGAGVTIPIAMYLFSRMQKVPMLYVMDRLVITVALGGVLIRLGNLMNSEIYGIESTLPWAFVFVRDGQEVPRHPTQIYEALAYLITFFVILYTYIKSKGKPKQGVIFGTFLVLVFTARFIIEFIKVPQVEREADWVLNLGQLLSLPFALMGVALIIWAYLTPAPEVASKATVKPNINVKRK